VLESVKRVLALLLSPPSPAIATSSSTGVERAIAGALVAYFGWTLMAQRRGATPDRRQRVAWLMFIGFAPPALWIGKSSFADVRPRPVRRGYAAPAGPGGMR
jgi:hypothetical protein